MSSTPSGGESHQPSHPCWRRWRKKIMNGAMSWRRSTHASILEWGGGVEIQGSLACEACGEGGAGSVSQ